MLFIENNIFQYIAFTIAQICYMFNKVNICSWIILKIFETSPFIISNIHYDCSRMIKYLFEKKNIKMQKYNKKNI